MALKKTIVFSDGREVKDAYHRVENVSVHGKNSMTVLVNGYETVDSLPFVNHVLTGQYNNDGENPIKQAYEFLKTTQEFYGCEDC